VWAVGRAHSSRGKILKGEEREHRVSKAQDPAARATGKKGRLTQPIGGRRYCSKRVRERMKTKYWALDSGKESREKIDNRDGEKWSTGGEGKRKVSKSPATQGARIGRN